MIGWPKPGDKTSLRVQVIQILFGISKIQVTYQEDITGGQFTLTYLQQPWQELLDSVDKGEIIK